MDGQEKQKYKENKVIDYPVLKYLVLILILWMIIVLQGVLKSD